MFDPERAGDPGVALPAPDPVPVPDDPAMPAPARPTPRASRASRTWSAASTRQRAVVTTVAVLAATLVGGLLAWNVGRPAEGTIASRSGGPSSSGSADANGLPAGSPSAVPGGNPGPAPSFEPLTGASPTPVAVLTARGAIGAVVPLDAGFRLESRDGTPASALAARLTVEPVFAFSIKAEPDDRAALLTPAKPLTAGAVYRFALRGAGSELLDTWAFQARQPLRIVGSLPETHSSDVPLDTGIEVTFDQDGVTGAEDHVTIAPATAGRFEQHGRTLAFIPTRPLEPNTVYSVTVTRGIAAASTGEATNVDTRIQFETAAAGAAVERWVFEFPDEVNESRVSERPTIGLWVLGSTDNPAPTTTRLVVYRLADLDAAIAAYRTLRARPDWTLHSDAGLVDVSRLSRVVTANLPLNAFQNAFWVQLPDRLAAGWYLIQQADGTKPIQTVLQVTDVSGYLAISDTKTIVWANDIATGAPIPGATVSSEGVGFGRTDARGLALGTTPKTLLPTTGQTCDRPCDPVVVVRTADGRRMFLPASTGHDKLEGYGDIYWWSDSDARMWSLLHTDRSRYRPGDTVNLWGFARDRDTGTVPGEVAIRLVFADGENSAPPVVTVTRKPDSQGAFHGSLSLAGLPDGSYALTMSVGDRVIRTTNLQVGAIAKPAYQLDVTTGRRVYIVGDQVKVTVAAHFFEGTPVPGVGLRIAGFAGGSATTDSLGTAVWRTVATLDPDQDRQGPAITSIAATPARAEEAEIATASRDVLVFPSSRTIDATGRIVAGKVVASGGVHLVAVNRLEAALASGAADWDLDARGAAVRNAQVKVTFVELVPTRRQIRTEYDFVEKKVVPVFEVDVREVAAGTIRATTAADGSWTASVPASSTDHAYAIMASVGDADGHVSRASTGASRANATIDETLPFATLDRTIQTTAQDAGYRIGQPLDLTMTDPDLRQTTGDGSRYLFFTAQRGIRSVTVQASRRYRSIFPTSGPPNLSVGAVRFTGRSYVGTAWFGAGFRAEDRRLQVDVTTDAATYRPGESVTVRVRTRTAGGAAVPATVVLRAVDEKLFVIGAAATEDPLAELYTGVGAGVSATYRSHRSPQGQSEGGDTTGGGGDDRDDFRDSLLFEAITTRADGWGSTTFKLSDDLTSWRVSASAVTSRLQAGSGSVLVPVGLPFFVDASIAPEYLAADRPTIAVRTFGSAIDTGAPVTIHVTSATLGFDSGELAGRASATIDVPLPALRSGVQTLTIVATTGSGPTARTDRLTRTFTVVETRLTRQRTSYVELPASGGFRGGSGLTTVLVSDASGGRYLPLLTELAAGGGGRLDRTLAADLAATLLEDRFAIERPAGSTPVFDAGRYFAADDGLAVVAYGSSDVELTALAALVAPGRFDRSKLTYYLRTLRDNPDETRERQLFALAGLAGLGEPVLPEIVAAAADPALTVREHLLLGLGAASLGDAATARRILDRLAAAHGEQAGTLARLRVGDSTADITAGTALAAALAAAVGSPLAPRFWAYVEANPARDRIEVLPAMAFVTQMIAHLPVQAARFTWAVGGERHVVELATGGSFQLALTAAQLATLSITPLGGTVGVTTRWREDVAPSAFAPDPDLTISRAFTPAAPGGSDLVVVELHVRFTTRAGNGCRDVVELVPSGLTPVGAESRWLEETGEEDGPPDDGVVLPYEQTASRVSFCVAPSGTRREFTLRYVARVVTTGSYAWEPAVAQSATDEAIANLTPAASITIR